MSLTSPPSAATSPPLEQRVATRDLLVELRFQPVKAPFTDQQPGYRYDFGNFVLSASQVTSEYLRPEILFTGLQSTPRSVGMVEFSLPLEMESYEQGVALIAYNIGNDFTPARATPWLLLGRMWEEHLPGKREMRLYKQRPQCHVNAEWFRVAVKKLIAAGEKASDESRFTVTFRDSVLKFDLAGEILAMPAAGNSWKQVCQCRTRELMRLSKRTPSSGMPFCIWDNCLLIGNRRVRLEALPVAAESASASSAGSLTSEATCPMSKDDLGAMFDEVLAEELAKVAVPTNK